MADSRIETYLATLKAEGRSSPAGHKWHLFYVFLQSRMRLDSEDPPMPLILAASGEADASKHCRLSKQLFWAHDNACLDEALAYLNGIPADEWSVGSPGQWHQEFYPSSSRHLPWSFESKDRVEAEAAANAIEALRVRWPEIAGAEISNATKPLWFTGAKRRRLVVEARFDLTPPWGTWTTLDIGENRRSFTRLRTAINAAIKPLEVDHIDFVPMSISPSE